MQVKNILLIPFVALYSAGSNVQPIERGIQQHATEGKTALLKYKGSVSSPYANFSVGAQISLDTSIGFRYDVTFQNGNTVMSHVAIFYKFSNPYQTIYYNYLNHKTDTIKQTEGDPNNNVTEIGEENIGSYPCMHLRHSSDHASENYWMSKSVPGYSQLTQTLKYIDPGLMASINGTIFNWGGLVRLKMVSTEPKGQTTFVLNLIEAQTGLEFQPSDFEVPSN